MFSWLQRILTPAQKPPVKPVSRPAAPAPAPQPLAAAPTPAVKEVTAPTASETRGRKFSSISWLQRSDINAAFTTWLFEGGGRSDMFTNKLEDEILAALDKIISSNQSGANLVRRMPGVIPQLLQSLRTENFSGAELAKKISHDVALVGAVIRVANSAAYAPGGKPITSIEHGILVLGQTGLRQLITSVAFQPIIDLNSGTFTKMVAPLLWEQSEKCAVANRMLAPEYRADHFEAFLAGLIQNVGLIVSLRVLDQMVDGKQKIGSETFCNEVIERCRTLSCSIAREWHFPESVVSAIAEQGNTNKNAVLSPMGKVLSTGDYLSKIHMLGTHERLPEPPAHYAKDLSDSEAACLDALSRIEDNAA